MPDTTFSETRKLTVPDDCDAVPLKDVVDEFNRLMRSQAFGGYFSGDQKQRMVRYIRIVMKEDFFSTQASTGGTLTIDLPTEETDDGRPSAIDCGR